MSRAAHEHPQPPIPPLDTSMYGKDGETEPTPIAALLAAAVAGCKQCYRTQLMAVAASPILVAHLAACGYLVLKTRAERTGVPVPEVKELAETYVSTTAAMFAAFSLDAFSHALLFAENAEPAKLRASAKETAALFVDYMKSGEAFA